MQECLLGMCSVGGLSSILGALSSVPRTTQTRHGGALLLFGFFVLFFFFFFFVFEIRSLYVALALAGL